MRILLNDPSLDFTSPHGKTIAVIHSDIMPRADTSIVFKDNDGNFIETWAKSVMINYPANCVICFVATTWPHKQIAELQY